MSELTEAVEKLDLQVDGSYSWACACMGPRDGDPVCPCDMQNVIKWRGQYIRLTKIIPEPSYQEELEEMEHKRSLKDIPMSEWTAAERAERLAQMKDKK